MKTRKHRIEVVVVDAKTNEVLGSPTTQLTEKADWMDHGSEYRGYVWAVFFNGKWEWAFVGDVGARYVFLVERSVC